MKGRASNKAARVIILVLMFAVAPLAHAMRMRCPPFSSSNPIVGTSSTWTGAIAGRSLTCRLCAFVVEIGNLPSGSVAGHCGVKHFRHRRHFRVTFTNTTSTSGTFCRQAMRSCCTLTVPSVVFDATHPPVSLSGAFACPQQSGTFSLSSATAP